ncbi:MAG: excinuclease ABC subunit B, partial [Alkalinema sp. FL-bin-369]|nr:excinuclease ABC subunit B [Leptolyngbyaceae cyanobacterium LF-bin-369]
MPDFVIKAPFEPAGDQPTAIAAMRKTLDEGVQYQTLLGATGTGKTHSIALVIDGVQRPTLIFAHNKTL